MDRPDADRRPAGIRPRRTRRRSGCGITLRAVPAGGGRRHLLRAARRADRAGPGPSGRRPGSPSTSRRSACSPSTPPRSRRCPPTCATPRANPGRTGCTSKTSTRRWPRQAWDRFLAALEPLRDAGKLGAILLQFPPWFPICRANREYILACAQRAAPRRVCVEFRNRTWMTEDNQHETLDFLTAHQLPYVCVDDAAGLSRAPSRRCWPPPATWPWSGCTATRTSGRARTSRRSSATGTATKSWTNGRPGSATWPAQAETTDVVFNNCYRDYAQVNAQQLMQARRQSCPV